MGEVSFSHECQLTGDAWQPCGCKEEQDTLFASLTLVNKCDVIPEKGQERSTCPQDVSLTWSEERTRSGGDGNVLPTPERDTERQTGERDIRMEGRDERKSAHVCRHACVYLGAAKVGKNWIGKDSKWGRRKKLIEGREEETGGGEMGKRGKRDEMRRGSRGGEGWRRKINTARDVGGGMR